MRCASKAKSRRSWSATTRIACTCQWWVEHGGSRGKCKHVLAVDIARGNA
ncbi:SWIM zinc finger family protein [Saccharopolyspora erythraea]|nr:SWIM zinc finger family protein [Saccharopolyspora erythraea]